MQVKAHKLRGSSRHAISYGGVTAEISAGVAPSGNLFFSGHIGADKVAGFLNRTGGYYAKSDALGRRDERGFVDAVADAAGYKTK